MIAMQYSFTLPADYDMGRIDQRIAEKGPALDGLARLRFKAYLSAPAQPGAPNGEQNLYAPFYLWDEPKGASDFLAHPGFQAVAKSFGWPTVQLWLPLEVSLDGPLQRAVFASRTISPIVPFSDIAKLHAEMQAKVEQANRMGALATVTGIDPTGWRSVEFSLWQTVPTKLKDSDQLYKVGHIST